MPWHTYDIHFDGFEPFTGADYQLARFGVTKDEGLRTWEVRVKVRPSLREALAEQTAGLSDRDVAGGLGAQTILTLLQGGIEPFEQDIVLDRTHYPGEPGRPEIRRDYQHITVRVEASPQGEVIPPL